MIEFGVKTIKTPRLTLRKFCVDDYKSAYKNWTSSETVSKYLPWYAHKSENETKEAFIDLEKRYVNSQYYNWCIDFDGECIGYVCVEKFDEQTKTAKTAYCVGEKFWGMGFVTEAYKAVLDYLFKEVKINKISTNHDLRNIGSGRVMEKCGLKEIRQERVLFKDKYIDISVKEITKDEFFTLNP